MPIPTTLSYSWQRRWLPVTPTTDQLAPPYEIDQAGYVSLHRESLGLEPEWLGVQLDELIPKQRCVVLLGEPGIGKSREWHVQQARFSGQADHLFLDLGSIDSEETLRREILDSAAVATWRAADTSLTLWLDSLGV